MRSNLAKSRSPLGIPENSDMKPRTRLYSATLVAAVLALSPALVRAMSLEQAMAQLKTHTFGRDDQALALIREAAVASHGDPALRKRLNAGLSAVLQSDAAYDAKQFACRQLALTATAEQVPILARHLGQEKLTHMVLYVLTHIEGPEVDRALLAALPGATGRAKLGIIHLLGTRRCRDAVPALGGLAGSSEPLVAAESVRALGRIGTLEAMRQLRAYRARAAGAVLELWAQACIDCADSLLAEHARQPAVAAYTEVLRSQAPAPARAAALKGLVLARPAEAMPLLLDALGSSERPMAQMAVHLAATMPGSDATTALAAHVPGLDAHAQVALLGALAARADPAALPTVAEALGSRVQAVRIAALRAVAALGNASSVKTLADHAAGASGAELQAARTALERLRGDRVHSTMAALLETADDRAKAELLTALAARGASEATSAVLAAAMSNSAAVRASAFKALRVLAGAADLPALFDLLVSARPADRANAAATVTAVARRFAAAPAASEIAMARLETVREPVARASILLLLGTLGQAKSLPVLRAVLEDPDPTIRDAAVRAFSRWPAATAAGEPMDDLLAIARTSGNRTHRLLALRGYIELIPTATALTPAQKARACQAAIELAPGPGQKKNALAKAGELDDIEALKLACRYLDDAALKNEAAAAAVKVARRTYARAPKATRAAMEQVLAAAAGTFVSEAAREIIGDIDALKGYLTDWQVAGPYTQQGKGCLELFDIPFGPEVPGADVAWKDIPLTALGKHPAYLDLLEALGGGELRVAYLRTTLRAKGTTRVRLEIYSDDGVKAWLNGRVIHANNTMRPIPEKPDVVDVTLQEGANELMLKITQNNMPWGAVVLLRELSRQGP